MKGKAAFIIFIFLLGNFGLKAQSNLKDNDLYCEQYSKIIEIISSDSIAKKEFSFEKLVFQIDNKIIFGIGNPLMTRYYVAGTLGVDPKGLDFKDSTVTKLWKDTEKEEYSKSKNFENSLCLTGLQRKGSSFNVYLSFARKSDKIVFVNSSMIYDYPRHSNGIFYLVFFDNDNNVHKIYRADWIE